VLLSRLGAIAEGPRRLSLCSNQGYQRLRVEAARGLPHVSIRRRMSGTGCDEIGAGTVR